jgi:hypothetical protein
MTRKPYGVNFVMDFSIEDQLDAALGLAVREVRNVGSITL